MTSRRSGARPIALGVAAHRDRASTSSRSGGRSPICRTAIIHLFWTLQLNLTFNSGMAFGRGRGFGPIIAVVGVCLVAGLLLGTSRAPTKVAAVAGGLVLGGAISNLLDRFFREGSGFLGGRVVDFIDPQWYPVFNVADACVVIGGILLVVVGVWSTPKHPIADPP